MELRYLGHSCVELVDGDVRVLVDPFLTGNPKAAATAEEVAPTHILLTHGHADHYGDVVEIAKRTGAPVLALVEIADELSELGVEQVHDPNLGGTVQFDWGWVKLVPAWHTSTTPNGTVCLPAGLLIAIGGNHVDVALVPIGGHYTMDRYDAVTACEFIGADVVIPVHFNTFPPIETDAEAFKSDVENATETKVVILEPGETHSAR